MRKMYYYPESLPENQMSDVRDILCSSLLVSRPTDAQGPFTILYRFFHSDLHF